MNSLEGYDEMKNIEKVADELRHIINIENNREKNNCQKINELYPNLKILRLLGKGSFGSVHECYEPISKTSKALKIM